MAALSSASSAGSCSDPVLSPSLSSRFALLFLFFCCFVVVVAVADEPRETPGRDVPADVP